MRTQVAHRERGPRLRGDVIERGDRGTQYRADSAEHPGIAGFEERLGGGTCHQYAQFLGRGAGKQPIEQTKIGFLCVVELAGDRAKQGSRITFPLARREIAMLGNQGAGELLDIVGGLEFAKQ